MKKYLMALIAGLFLSIDSPAQGFFDTLNKAVNGLSRQSQQRNSRSNNNHQRSYERRQTAENKKDGSSRDKNTEVDNNDTQKKESFLQSNVNTEPEQKQSGVEPQSNEKVITLVVNGTGNAKEDAVKNALRSAIEQAFGTFVSANTEVLNDELIKDEITTVSTGNIKSYKELSITQTSNGLYDASVQATVSIDQLTKFAQSKGMQAELAGAAFVMNMKMRELNKNNELVAMRHLVAKLMAIAQKGLYDYEIEIGEPQLNNDKKYTICITVAICENENTKAFNNEINQTLQALSLSEKEKSEYKQIGLKCYYLFDYCLRDNYDIKEVLNRIIIDNIFDYVIQDNLGNKYYFYKTYLNGTSSYKAYEAFLDREHFDHSANYYPSESEKRMYFYEFNKKDKILPIVKDGYTTATHIAHLARDYYGNTPRNYIGTGTELSFFPTPKGHYRNENKGKYYKQEYRLIYSEEELSKLNSITIEHRKK